MLTIYTPLCAYKIENHVLCFAFSENNEKKNVQVMCLLYIYVYVCRTLYVFTANIFLLHVTTYVVPELPV